MFKSLSPCLCDSCTGNSTIGHAKSRRAHDIQINVSGPLCLHVCPLCLAAPLSSTSPLFWLKNATHPTPRTKLVFSPLSPTNLLSQISPKGTNTCFGHFAHLTPCVTFTAKAKERIAPKCHFPPPPSPASAHPWLSHLDHSNISAPHQSEAQASFTNNHHNTRGPQQSFA